MSAREGCLQEQGTSGALPGLLEVEVEVDGGAAAVRVRGDVDVATGERFAAALVEPLGSGAQPSELVVDLSGVRFVDGGGVRAIARGARLAAARGVRMRLLSCRALDDMVQVLGGWRQIGVDEDAVSIEAADHADERGHSSEYAHLMPLFGERGLLAPDDPRDAALRADLITGYLPVAQHIARRFRSRGENPDDLEQVAAVGLINAVDRFEVGRGVDFLAFAVPTITGELHRHFRDRTATIRTPRRIRSLQAMVQRAVEELRRRDGTAPRPTEIAQHLQIEPAEVLEALEAAQRGRVSSLDEPFPGDEGPADNPRFASALAVADPDVGLVVDRESLSPLLGELPDRERRILLLRFFGNRTQSQIAGELGISQMHVSRLLSSTLARLRKGMDRPGPADG
jgi:RNA polymerase sigma-B factor